MSAKQPGTTPGGVAVPMAPRVKPANGQTYTWEEFHQATGKGPQNYQKYLTYLANHRGKAVQEARAPFGGVDPYAAFRPTPEAEGLGQARAAGMAAFAPSIAGAQQTAQRDMSQFTQLLGRYNKDMAAYLRPQVQGALDVGHQTAAALAAEGAGLAQMGQQQGARGQAQLADFLQLINAPQEARQFAVDARTRGDQVASGIAAAANMAQNNATIGQGVQGNFLAALPRIQEIAGRQDLVGGLQKFAQTRDDELSKLRSERAAQIQKLYEDYRNREFDKATALNTFGLNVQGAQADAAAAAQPKPVKYQAKVDYTTGNVYSYDPTTGQVAVTGHVKPHPASGGGKGGSPRAFAVDQSKALTQVDKALSRWAKKIPTFTQGPPETLLGVTRPGEKKKTGSKTVYTNYQAMVRDAVAHVSPLLSPYMSQAAIRDWVKQKVDMHYTPGRYGFPMTPQQRAAAQQAALPAGPAPWDAWGQSLLGG